MATWPAGRAAKQPMTCWPRCGCGHSRPGAATTTEHADARPWLFGIARNVLRERWRTSGSQPAALDEAVTDPWDGIDARLGSAGRARVVASAVRALPAAEREVLLLVAWEQLTPAEAAKVLRIPQGTARSRLHRARAALRHVLSGSDADETGVRT